MKGLLLYVYRSALALITTVKMSIHFISCF